MALDAIVRGSTSGNGAEVDADNYLYARLAAVLAKAGFVAATGEVHDGASGAARLLRPLDVSPDYRLRVGTDSVLWQDTFSHTVFNTSTYQGVTSTMTVAPAGGRLVFNGGNSVTSAHVARAQTYRTFPVIGTYATYVDFGLMLTQDPQANNVCEFGLGYAATTTAPTDGVFWRYNASGELKGVVNNNGTETQTSAITPPPANEIHHYLIVIHVDRTEFWIDDQLMASVDTPTTSGSPCQSNALPLLMREYNSGAVSVAQRMEVAWVNVSLGDLNASRLWATQMIGMGRSSINAPDGATAGYTANHANSAAPASATLSNTAAGYTTLGGQWQFAAVAGAETDYALFAYTVPAGTAANPGKNLIIRGVRIDTFNMGAAVATTGTTLQWAIGVGATAVSLATADSATAGTRAARRLPIGAQNLPVSTPVGGMANQTIDVNLDAPLIAEPGTVVHLILKMPVGTATASQIVRGTAMFNAYFE